MLWENHREHTARNESGKDTKTWRFEPKDFYHAWFRGPKSNPYFFLFKKNLTVTNLQFAELLALLRIHTRRQGDDRRPDLQFLSTAEFNEKVEALLVALTGDSDDQQSVLLRCETFEESWGDLLQRTVVIDAFYGSCVVFFPPGLELDLALVCAQSGYIHSCGPSVWARKVKKADSEELARKLRDRVGNDRKRTTFAVYSHEDFTEFDREEASELRHGLDDVKIWVAKYWMGGQRLTSVLKDLNEKIPQLEVAGAGDYREVRARMSQQEDMDNERCFWLIVDRAVDDDGVHAGRERYYLCYEQHYYNENPFHTFDENKPAWRAHTTLPHTLTGAMINLTLPYWNTAQPRLMDPFVGTGTTLLEAAKFPELLVAGVDSDPIAPLLVEDNIEFFSRSAERLHDTYKYLDQVIAVKEVLDDGQADSAALIAHPWKDAGENRGIERRLPLDDDRIQRMVDVYERVEQLVEPVAKDPDSEFTLEDRGIEEIQEWESDERLLLYIGLRAVRRNVAARERNDERGGYRRAWLGEAKVLRRQVEHVVGRYGKRTLETVNDSVRVFAGFYSRECSIEPKLIARLKADEGVVRCEDALGLIENSSFDLFVTDPPYGFNTDVDSGDLAQLYREIIRLALTGLRDGGQLVMALPDQSFIGRDPGYFANRRFVEQQVTALAHDLDRELAVSSEILPASPPIYRAPYFWESERALRRSIVHYRLRGSGPDAGSTSAVGLRLASRSSGGRNVVPG